MTKHDILARGIASTIREDVANLTTGLSDLTTVVSNKANKTQSAWIDAPLIAPTENYGGDYQTAQYMKDEFGVVHIRGFVKGSLDDTVAFVLPNGYRPAKRVDFEIVQNSSFGVCIVLANGEVKVRGSGVKINCSFGYISFVAV